MRRLSIVERARYVPWYSAQGDMVKSFIVYSLTDVLISRSAMGFFQNIISERNQDVGLGVNLK